MAQNDPELHELCAKWKAHDWYAGSREAVWNTFTNGTYEDLYNLKQLMTPRIAFGTAGLRAEMLPGFAMINHVTVRQTVLGLADYLQELLGVDACRRGVVIGHDHRAMPQPFSHPKFASHPRTPVWISNFNSLAFAELAAATLQVKGFQVLWLGKCHTPLVSWAIPHLHAAAGIMITASHNPRAYNGLKVYLENGCQINQPHDSRISAVIQRNLSPPEHAKILERPRKTLDSFRDYSNSSVNGQDISHQYYSAIDRFAAWPRDQMPDKFVFTALHGVGAGPRIRLFETLFRQSPSCMVVDEQEIEDPNFPTVRFPNPEEEGALDMAMRRADETGCDFIVAVDPDADRFAAAERLPSGDWHRYTGNQTGILLAAYILERYDKSSHESSQPQTAMLTSTVSTGMLKAIAERNKFYFEETLTGFKWMSNRAQALRLKGFDVRFAFEEALGYMFPAICYDKDGISATAVFLAARLQWEQAGLTPWGKLQTLYEKYGYFADANTYVLSPSSEKTTEVFSAIRNSQQEQGAGTKERPAILRGRICKSYRDLTTGVDTSQPDSKAILPIDPQTHMITCELDNARFTLRGSGTEPKIKLYVECSGNSMQSAQDEAAALQKDIIQDWLAL